MIGNKPLVSVIIPAYNHEKYVQDTIKSIINQTYENIELIVVDDGSKDTTWNKIQEMKEECEKRFAFVHFETKENEGTCKTLNRLLDLAHGEYVYMIASDDLAKQEAIETEINFLQNNSDYSLVVGNNEIINSEGDVNFWDNNRNLVKDKKQAKFLTFGQFLQSRRPEIDFNSDEFGSYGSLMKLNYIPNGYLIRKSIFERIGHFTPDAPLEDYWLMLQISKFSKLKYINKVLFSYRWHNNNTIKNIEKMDRWTEITRNYEKNLLENTNKTILSFSAIHYLNYGIKYEHFGIKNIFEVDKYKKDNIKTKTIKLFGIQIFQFSTLKS